MFQYRLRELLAEKERQVGHRIPLRAVSEATGVSIQVLSSLNSPARKVVTNTAYLDALCLYFECTPADLLIHVRDADAEGSCHVDRLYPDRKRRREDG